jgi:chromosome segregation ATPase
MKGASDMRSRNEITEEIEKHDQDMNEKNEELDEIADDNQVVHETLETLSGSTCEGTEQAEQCIQAASDATIEDFDSSEGELEGLEQETENTRNEIQEMEKNAESDHEKIDGALEKLQREAARSGLEGAEASVQEDIDFLNKEDDRADEAIEAAKAACQTARGRLNG